MRKTYLLLAVLLLAVAGICVMLWPAFTGHRLQADTDAAVQSFLKERKPEQQYPELLAALQEYNRQLYAEKQCNLTDLEACEEPAADLTVYGNEKNTKGKVVPVAREIDFIATSGGKKTYIQSAYALGTAEKAITENKPFALTGDSFPKIIVRHDIRKRWYDEGGILNIGVIDFLLDDTLV